MGRRSDLQNFDYLPSTDADHKVLGKITVDQPVAFRLDRHRLCANGCDTVDQFIVSLVADCRHPSPAASTVLELGTIPNPFLAVLLLWMIVLFAGFSLMAPANATTFASLVICALSVSAAIFLILELDQPFSGIMMIQSEPLRNALPALNP